MTDAAGLGYDSTHSRGRRIEPGKAVGDGEDVQAGQAPGLRQRADGRGRRPVAVGGRGARAAQPQPDQPGLGAFPALRAGGRGAAVDDGLLGGGRGGRGRRRRDRNPGGGPRDGRFAARALRNRLAPGRRALRLRAPARAGRRDGDVPAAVDQRRAVDATHADGGGRHGRRDGAGAGRAAVRAGRPRAEAGARDRRRRAGDALPRRGGVRRRRGDRRVEGGPGRGGDGHDGRRRRRRRGRVRRRHGGRRVVPAGSADDPRRGRHPPDRQVPGRRWRRRIRRAAARLGRHDEQAAHRRRARRTSRRRGP